MTPAEERELLERYRPWLFGTARGLLGGRLGRQGVEDLAQEGWIAMWRVLRGDYGTREVTDYWLHFNARRRMTQVVRNWFDAKKQRQFIWADDVTRIVELTSHLGAVELAYHQGEIYEAIGALPEDHRRYIVLRFWGGLTETMLVEHLGPRPHDVWPAARKRLAPVLQHLADQPKKPPAPVRRGRTGRRSAATDQQLQEIKRRLAEGEQGRQIARSMGVSEHVVSRVKRGETRVPDGVAAA
jgi:RNA polymerase sigma factor (sigma-70 family)